ncbi:hypothetical protein TSUD_371900 [Trifolium subterraneum]|uniref:Uncharacterized protein n=1 Tax=Trifolium subterraneum TaxID=3900 RepID=A0A2Z6NYI4_TRISU|nr:hypothetical protein TSUD_371900 [Trifolium subterraneum]
MRPYHFNPSLWLNHRENIEVLAKPISESSPSLEPYFDNLVTDSTKIVDDIGESAIDNVKRIHECRREDGFVVQCDSQLTVNTTGDCNSGVIATPKLPNAESITTHSVHNNEDILQFDEPQSKVNKDDFARNQGLSLQCEIPFALYLSSIVNNHASSLEPKFGLHCHNLLAEISSAIDCLNSNMPFLCLTKCPNTVTATKTTRLCTIKPSTTT